MPLRILLFVATNILIVITVSFVAALLGIGNYIEGGALNYGALFGFCLLWGFVGSFISLAISRWVAKKFMKITVVDRKTHVEYDWLITLVEQTARQARLPEVPEIGVFAGDEINAFATGPSKKKSLVAFSTGLLEQMDRDAVEGVVAHEIAHIANGDMITLTLIQGVVNAFVLFFSRIIAWAASQAVDEKLSTIVWYATSILFQIVFGILGMIVTSWFSRKREFRADALSAKLVGVGKMRAALEFLEQMKEDKESEELLPSSMAAFGIRSKRTSGLLALWSTHPPLERRIAALDSLQ